MNDNLCSYIENLFKSLPNTKKIIELKEELCIDLNEKYNDLIQSGHSKESALNIVIEGIGDINELLIDLNPKDIIDFYNNKQQKKSAILIISSIAMYIFSLICTIFCESILNFPNDVCGIVFLTLSGIATCLLVYNHLTKPKQNISCNNLNILGKKFPYKNKNEEPLDSIIHIMWLAIVILFLFISFNTHCWNFSWIIFLVGVLIEKIIRLRFSLKND